MKHKSPADEIAEKIMKIANEPKTKNLLLELPTNEVGLPSGSFALNSFLRYIAKALKSTKA